MIRRLLARVAIALGLVAAASPAAAWWEYGHYTVAEIAEMSLTPRTRAKVQALLRQGALLQTPTCSTRTLALTAYWPDCAITLGERFSYTRPWHYQNVNICAPFDLKAPCANGNCVSAQIERQVKLLQDKDVPPRDKLMALAFLAHFVGDLHNPLHAGDHEDRGGNNVKARYGIIEGRANLHSVWDGWIAERAISEPPGGARALLEAIPVGERAALAGGTVEDWSRENWALSREIAYTSALNGDPCKLPQPTDRVLIDEAKVRSYIPVVRREVAKAGLRLARLIEEGFSDQPDTARKG